MYADDTNITLAASIWNFLKREMNNEQRTKKRLNNWFYGKTEFMLIGSRQRLRLQGIKQIQIQIEGVNISQVEKVKLLDVFALSCRAPKKMSHEIP